ncbi:MAG: hypothetical protein ACFNX2_05385, partial [Porphyromonas pasteri]
MSTKSANRTISVSIYALVWLVLIILQTLVTTVQGVGNTQTIDVETGKRNPMRQVYQLAADVQHGNSGGPVLDE